MQHLDHIDRCDILDNVATNSGGGIRCYDGGTIRNGCRIVGNRLEFHLVGGDVVVWQTPRTKIQDLKARLQQGG